VHSALGRTIIDTFLAAAAAAIIINNCEREKTGKMRKHRGQLTYTLSPLSFSERKKNYCLPMPFLNVRE
jgi:hypothetical protein